MRGVARDATRIREGPVGDTLCPPVSEIRVAIEAERFRPTGQQIRLSGLMRLVAEGTFRLRRMRVRICCARRLFGVARRADLFGSRAQRVIDSASVRIMAFRAIARGKGGMNMRVGRTTNLRVAGTAESGLLFSKKMGLGRSVLKVAPEAVALLGRRVQPLRAIGRKEIGMARNAEILDGGREMGLIMTRRLQMTVAATVIEYGRMNARVKEGLHRPRILMRAMAYFAGNSTEIELPMFRGTHRVRVTTDA